MISHLAAQRTSASRSLCRWTVESIFGRAVCPVTETLSGLLSRRHDAHTARKAHTTTTRTNRQQCAFARQKHIIPLSEFDDSWRGSLFPISSTRHCEDCSPLLSREAERTRREFWELYYGELAIVEAKEVEDAMVAYGNKIQEWREGPAPAEFRELARQLRQTCDPAKLPTGRTLTGQ